MCRSQRWPFNKGVGEDSNNTVYQIEMVSYIILLCTCSCIPINNMFAVETFVLQHIGKDYTFEFRLPVQNIM